MGRTRPTIEGLTFIALSLFVGFAAINTGNNLIYLTFGIMMSFAVASGILSMINLSWIAVSLNLPRDLFALTPSPLTFSLTNTKSFISSYSLTVKFDLKRGIEVEFKAPERTFSIFETGRSPTAVLRYLALFELRERAQA